MRKIRTNSKSRGGTAMRKIKQTVAAILMVGGVLGGTLALAQPAEAALKPCYPNCPW